MENLLQASSGQVLDGHRTLSAGVEQSYLQKGINIHIDVRNNDEPTADVIDSSLSCCLWRDKSITNHTLQRKLSSSDMMENSTFHDGNTSRLRLLDNVIEEMKGVDGMESTLNLDDLLSIFV